jgi:hypothetical protein
MNEPLPRVPDPPRGEAPEASLCADGTVQVSYPWPDANLILDSGSPADALTTPMA